MELRLCCLAAALLAIANGLGQARFVTVEPGVKLEVLDWGGAGRPVVLLAGLGNDAHVFDTFAPKLTGKYHVYGITRRGYGKSDSPVPAGENYSADRLGDDVIAVLDTLKLDKPVLVGHSIAGEELSSIGSRHPERVAGLVYLEAGYPYALYNAERGDAQVDVNAMRRDLDAIALAVLPEEQKKAVAAAARDLPRFEQGLTLREKQMETSPSVTPAQLAQIMRGDGRRRIASGRAITSGMQRYTQIQCPVLAIFAEPHDLGQLPPGVTKEAAEAHDKEATESQAKLFEALPQARVVRIPNADHYVFRSNEAEVVREMDRFIGGLK